MKTTKEVSVVIPCINEEESIGQSIETIQKVFTQNKINGEIIVVDNNSTDGTSEIALKYPIKYIFESNRGYGNAYKAGLKHAEGNLIIMGDPDNSYDFNDIPKFLFHLQKYDFVIGSRFLGKIKPGAMPLLHRYLGNPGIRSMMKILHGVNPSEPSTGFVGIKKELLEKLNLKQQGMEFSSEIIIKVHKIGATVKEIPITYHIRSGKSKVKPLSDGLRHARYLIK